MRHLPFGTHLETDRYDRKHLKVSSPHFGWNGCRDTLRVRRSRTLTPFRDEARQAESSCRFTSNIEVASGSGTHRAAQLGSILSVWTLNLKRWNS